MNKPRLPTDISFLLESVMSKTPDQTDYFKKKKPSKLVESSTTLDHMKLRKLVKAR